MSNDLSPIFPGMDPNLENPQIWPGVHSRFIVYLCDALQPLVRPRYFATIEERVYVEGPDRSLAPDVWVLRRSTSRGAAGSVLDADEPEIEDLESVEVRETFIEIRHKSSGQEVATVIELLSPANKTPGSGRDLYLKKQAEVLTSAANLVEIDLLREGQHTVAVPEPVPRFRGPYDYLVCVNRAVAARTRYEWYRVQLSARLPRARIPLAGSDP